MDPWFEEPGDRGRCGGPGRLLGRFEAAEEDLPPFREPRQGIEPGSLERIRFLLEEVEDGEARLVIGLECRLECGVGVVHGAVLSVSLALREATSDSRSEIRRLAMFCSSCSEGELVGDWPRSFIFRISE